MCKQTTDWLFTLVIFRHFLDTVNEIPTRPDREKGPSFIKKETKKKLNYVPPYNLEKLQVKDSKVQEQPVMYYSSKEWVGHLPPDRVFFELLSILIVHDCLHTLYLINKESLRGEDLAMV